MNKIFDNYLFLCISKKLLKQQQISNLENFKNYSTIEQAIGTWIDGKILYRRCFDSHQITVTKEQWTNLADLGSNAIDTLVNSVAIDTIFTKSISPVFVAYSSPYLQAYSYSNIKIDKIIIEYTKP